MELLNLKKDGFMELSIQEKTEISGGVLIALAISLLNTASVSAVILAAGAAVSASFERGVNQACG